MLACWLACRVPPAANRAAAAWRCASLAGQPAQDGAAVGGEGDAQPEPPQRGRHPRAQAAAAPAARAGDELHRGERLGGAAAQGRARERVAAGGAVRGGRARDAPHVPRLPAGARRPLRVQPARAPRPPLRHRRLPEVRRARRGAARRDVTGGRCWLRLQRGARPPPRAGVPAGGLHARHGLLQEEGGCSRGAALARARAAAERPLTPACPPRTPLCQGVVTMTMRELFDFVTDPVLREEEEEQAIERLLAAAAQRPAQSDKEKTDEAVFRKVRLESSPERASRRQSLPRPTPGASSAGASAYIPKTLDGVIDAERDIARIQDQLLRDEQPQQQGAEALPSRTPGDAPLQETELYYTKLVGLTDGLQVRQRSSILEPAGGGQQGPGATNGGAPDGGGTEDIAEDSGSSGGSSGSSSDEGEEAEIGDGGVDVAAMRRHGASKEEVRAARRENKARVKEEAREKRKHKTPKKVRPRGGRCAPAPRGSADAPTAALQVKKQKEKKSSQKGRK
eukprot:scaffold834_cov311-Prasinococcus_capsulatus_cf.AAC.5